MTNAACLAANLFCLELQKLLKVFDALSIFCTCVSFCLLEKV